MKTEQIVSPLPPEQVLENMIRQTVPYSLLSHFESCYYGKVRENRFRFYYLPAYVNNSFVTLLKGKVAPRNNGSIISYYFDKFIVVKLFAIFCTVFLGFCSFIMLLRDHSVMGIIPLLMIIVINLLTFISTKRAKNRLREKLKNICDVTSDLK